MKRFFAATVLLLTFGLNGLSAQQINTIPGGVGGINSMAFWGTYPAHYQGRGQVFTAPGSVLTQFSFFLQDYYDDAWSPDLGYYRAFVGAWNGSTVTSVLWESEDRANPTVKTAWQQATFTPGLALTSGLQYLAFLFPSNRGGLPPGYRDVDALGMMANSSGTGGAVVGVSWASEPGLPEEYYPVGGLDVAFIADFSSPTVVPEPSTWVLFATGLLGIGGVALRRRRNGAA